MQFTDEQLESAFAKVKAGINLLEIIKQLQLVEVSPNILANALGAKFGKEFSCAYRRLMLFNTVDRFSVTIEEAIHSDWEIADYQRMEKTVAQVLDSLRQHIAQPKPEQTVLDPESPKPKKRCCGGKYPSTATMAKNLVGAVTDVAKAALQGEEIRATKEEVESRLALCHTCEKYNSSAGRCQVCGCFVPVKVRAKVWHCPIGKW